MEGAFLGFFGERFVLHVLDEFLAEGVGVVLNDFVVALVLEEFHLFDLGLGLMVDLFEVAGFLLFELLLQVEHVVG